MCHGEGEMTLGREIQKVALLGGCLRYPILVDYANDGAAEEAWAVCGRFKCWLDGKQATWKREVVALHACESSASSIKGCDKFINYYSSYH